MWNKNTLMIVNEKLEVILTASINLTDRLSLILYMNEID